MTEKNTIFSFYRRILLFITLVGVICCGFYLINQYLFQKIGPVIPKNKPIVACGTSLSAFSLNDEKIDSLINVSLPGRSGLSSFKTVEKIIEFNPHVHTVVVDFSIIGVTGIRDYQHLIPIMAAGEFESTYSIAGFEDYSVYLIHPKYYFLSLMHNEWVPNIDYIKKWWTRPVERDLDFPYLGEYIEKTGTKNAWRPDQWNHRLNMFRKLAGEEWPVNERDIIYMDSILHFTQRNDIQLIVYCAPMHEKILELVPDVYNNKYREMMGRADSYDHVEIFEMSSYPLPDSAYINFTHVNNYGAAIISREFCKRLEAIDVLHDGKACSEGVEKNDRNGI